MAARILPGGAGRASSAPLNGAALQPEAEPSASANHMQQSNAPSNAMALPPMAPVRTPHGLASPLGSQVVPTAAHGGRVTTREHMGIAHLLRRVSVAWIAQSLHTEICPMHPTRSLQ